MPERLVCDLCNEPWEPSMGGFTYTTPNPSPDVLMADVNAMHGTKQSLFYAEDEEWLVCLDCHILIEQGDESGLLSRSIHCQRSQRVVLGDDGSLVRLIEAEIARIHALFWQHKSPLPPIPEPGYRS